MGSILECVRKICGQCAPRRWAKNQGTGDWQFYRLNVAARYAERQDGYASFRVSVLCALLSTQTARRCYLLRRQKLPVDTGRSLLQSRLVLLRPGRSRAIYCVSASSTVAISGRIVSTLVISNRSITRRLIPAAINRTPLS